MSGLAFLLVRDGDQARALFSRGEDGQWSCLRWCENDDHGESRSSTDLGPSDDDARRAIFALLQQGFRNGL